MTGLQEAFEKIRKFRDERNWKQFHTPKNLTAAISIEAGELQEALLWKTDAEIQQFISTEKGKAALSAEVADVLIFCFLLCDVSSIDPLAAINTKIGLNELRYPVDLAKDNPTKYTDLKRSER